MLTLFALIALHQTSQAKLPQLPFTLSGASREAVEEFDVERQTARRAGWSDIHTTATSGQFLLLKEPGLNGDAYIQQIVVGADGAGQRAVMKIPGVQHNPDLLTATNQTGPRGESIIRVESTGEENAMGIRALDIFGVEKVGARQLRVRREHRDSHGRFTNNKSEFFVSDPPWRAIKAPSPDDVILDGTVQSSSVKLYTYNAKTDQFGEVTVRFDQRASTFDRGGAVTRRLAAGEVRSLGLEAEVKALPKRTPLTAPEGPHGMKTDDADDAGH